MNTTHNNTSNQVTDTTIETTIANDLRRYLGRAVKLVWNSTEFDGFLHCKRTIKGDEEDTEFFVLGRLMDCYFSVPEVKAVIFSADRHLGLIVLK